MLPKLPKEQNNKLHSDKKSRLGAHKLTPPSMTEYHHKDYPGPEYQYVSVWSLRLSIVFHGS